MTPEDLKAQLSTINGFLQEKNGFFLVVSADSRFTKIFEAAMRKYVELPAERYAIVEDTVECMSMLAKMTDRGVLLFVERMLFSKSCLDIISMVHEIYVNVQTIVLTQELRKHERMALHETGATNVLTKPVSTSSILEKIAYTIEPPSKIMQIIKRSRLLSEQGKHDKVLGLADSVLKLKAGSPAALILKGDALAAMSRFEDAVAAYEEAHNSAKLFLDPIMKLADIHKKLGNREKHLHYLRLLDRLSPANPDRKFNIAKIYLEKGDNTAADDYFTMAQERATIEAMSTISSVTHEIVSIYKEHDPASAEMYIARLLDAKGAYLSLDDLKALNELGISLRKQGKWKDAMRYYKKALEVAPENEELLYNLSMALAEGGKYRDAIPYIEDAMHANPEFINISDNVAYNVGYIYFKAEFNTEARFFFEKALSLNPDNQAAKKRIVKIDEIYDQYS